ncbi:MAG: FmdB family transcriptional regulator [Dehalococcoidales bacterium]|nr:FmdB family transcriptional regulator [Dehalococcoidales bacterium]
MPLYEYECLNCEEQFELLRNIGDSDETVKCPSCQEKSSKRVFSIFGTVSSSPACAPTPAGGFT